MSDKQPRRFVGVQLHTDFIDIIERELTRSAVPKGVYARWLGVSHPALSMVLKGRTGVSFEKADFMGRVIGVTLRMTAERLG